MGVMGSPESVGVARLAHVAGLWPACGRDARAPRGWPWERCSWERGPLARNGPKARKAPTGATRPSRLLPRPRPKARKVPRGATCLSHELPRPRRGHGSDGVSRERGCRPLGHVAGLWPACGRDARAPRGWPRKRCPWERGHLARNGPKARKAPRGATPPSRPPAHPRRPMPSRSALGALPRTGTGGARERGCRPLGHVAGLWPACGRDARAPRGWPCERCSWERGHLARNGPKARKVPRGATCLSHQLPRPRRGHGSDGVSRERGCRPLGHVAGLGAARLRAGRPRSQGARPCERCSWERGHLARNGPKARKAPRGATCLSRLLPRPRPKARKVPRGATCPSHQLPRPTRR